MAAELQARLRLANAPKRIECLDIATLQGGETVGAIVAFDEGAPHRDGTRRYANGPVEGPDDFAAVGEVLGRRFRGARARGGLPDLLVIDGGLGQLGAARAVFAELGLTDLEVVGLAKERVERDPTASEIRRRPERVFLPGRKNPVVLKPNSSALFLLQRVRDEAHRFVNLYHRKLRARARLRSRLDAIARVGPGRRACPRSRGRCCRRRTWRACGCRSRPCSRAASSPRRSGAPAARCSWSRPRRWAAAPRAARCAVSCASPSATRRAAGATASASGSRRGSARRATSRTRAASTTSGTSPGKACW